MGVIRNQSIKNFFSYYSAIIIGAVNTIFVYPNVFNDNPENYGLIQIIISYSVILSVFSQFGINSSFVRFFPDVKDKGQLLFFSVLVSLTGFLLIFGTYLLFEDQIIQYLSPSELLLDNFYYIFILTALIITSQLLTAISSSYLRVATPTFLDEVFMKVSSLFLLILLWFGVISFDLFLQLFFATYLVKALILFAVQLIHDRLHFTFNLKDFEFRKVLIFCSYVFFGVGASLVASKIDIMMIGYILDLQDVAFYTIAFFIGNVIIVPARGIRSISYPILANAFKENNHELIKDIYKKSSINQFLFGALLFLCIWLNIDDLFNLLPEKFAGGKYVVLFIAITRLFSLLTGVNGLILINSRFYKYDIIFKLPFLVIVVITNYLLIPIYNIEGAALATAVSFFCLYTCEILFVYNKMRIQPFSKKTIYVLLIILFYIFLIPFVDLTANSFINILIRSVLIIPSFIFLSLKMNISEDISVMIKDLNKRFSKS